LGPSAWPISAKGEGGADDDDDDGVDDILSSEPVAADVQREAEWVRVEGSAIVEKKGSTDFNRRKGGMQISPLNYHPFNLCE